MGSVIGTLIGFIGVAALIIPVIINFVVAGKKDDKVSDHVTALRASAVFIIVGAILISIGLLIQAFLEGSKTISAAGGFIKENPELLQLAAMA